MMNDFKLLIEKLTSKAEWCFSSSTDPDLDREKFKGMAETELREFFKDQGWITKT